MKTQMRRFPILGLVVCLIIAMVGCASDETATVDQLKAMGVLVVPGPNGKANSLNNLPRESAQLTEAINLIPMLSRVKTITALQGVPITDEHLATIGKLKTLVELTINGAAVTDKGVASLTGLRKLESLTLVGTEVSEASMPNFAKLSSLNMLNITDAKVNGGYEHLKQCKKLQWVLIGGLTISQEDATNISQIPVISHVTMNDKTQISPEALETLKSNRDCTVDSISTTPAFVDPGGE